MKRVRNILRAVVVGLVLAGAAVLTGCGDSHRHISYGGRGNYPVYSRGHDSSGWGGSRSGGRWGQGRSGGGSSGGRHDSGPWARR